jgi:molybdate transport system substrate-binding protein
MNPRATSALIVVLASCGGQKDAGPQTSQEAPRDAAAREEALVVFAAASLREAFTAIGQDFERAHQGVKITFNFAGTQELRTQLEHGAAADVFASADQKHMAELLRARRVTDPAVFARNEPVVVVAKPKAAALRTFADLPAAGRIVVGADEVPIGRYTRQILERAAQRLGADFRARVDARVVSRELNVRQVLAKVSLDEADAGIVYRTDAATAADRVTVVSIPEDINVIAEYPIAAVAGAAHPALARAWLELVLGPGGQQVLARAGFLPAVSGGVAPALRGGTTSDGARPSP